MSHVTFDAPSNRSSAELRSQPLQRLVRTNRRRWQLLAVLEGAGLTVAALLGPLWLLFWIDNQWHLPPAGRVLTGAAMLVVGGWLAFRFWRRWRMLNLSEDQVALAIERRTPGGVQNRLINALQLARASSATPAELKQAVIDENVEQLGRLPLQQATEVRPAAVRLAAAALCVAVGAAFYLWQPEQFTNAAARILMPLSDVAPLYRTKLTVEPGDLEAAGDVGLQITIQGETPRQLTLFVEVQGRRRSEAIPIPSGADAVVHTLNDVRQPTRYAVRGGDFTTRYYEITPPTPSHLTGLRSVWEFPEYTGLSAKTLESDSGELEGLQGARVELQFQFDQPCEQATLLVEQADPSAVGAAEGAATSAAVDSAAKAAQRMAGEATTRERITLQKLGPALFAGRLTLDRQTAYQIETRQVGRAPHVSRSYEVRVVVDQPPALELAGLEGRTEASLDADLPLKAIAIDDWGLAEVGLYYRQATPRQRAASGAETADAWRPIERWPSVAGRRWEQEFALTLLALDTAEGDRLEIALRAADHDPAKRGELIEGAVYGLKVGGESAALQLLYEQIVRSEAELKQIVADQRRLLGQTTEWIRKIDGEGGLSWDDPATLRTLIAAVGEQTKRQLETRDQAARSARALVEAAGSLRLSVGMLADTEMVRAVRIYESVPVRETLSAKRAALTDAQLTQQRTIASLQQIFEQYLQFRHDWELTHMTAFVKMLAERQAALAEVSTTQAERATAAAGQKSPGNSTETSPDKLAGARHASSLRRQRKLGELVELSQRALVGVGERLEESESPLAASFAAAGESLGDSTLRDSLQQAVDEIERSRWSEAAARQTAAAERLAAIHAALRKAQTEAARKTLVALEEKAKTDVQAQREVEKLKAGDDKTHMEISEKLKITDIIHMQELADGKKSAASEDEVRVNDYLFPDSRKHQLQQPDSGKRQQFELLKLGTNAGKTPSFPAQSDREANDVKPHVQEEFEDLVGKLLEEVDEMLEKYETLNLNAAFNINEPGEVGKLGGDMNSTAAAAATGNKKPPTTNVGGASRSGRRGARSHGMVVGDESVNRRGRDKVQEGQERVADQAGLIRETKSDDPQNDTSTGVGGKKVESDDTKFSVADVGKWTDDMIRRMGKPQDKNSIVERQDGGIDPRTAEMLRDLASSHEQIIERVKSIRKELKNLYLPTEHLDEILAELQSQFDRMQERPGAELFRREQQTLDKLRGALRVFHQAHAGFQPSVPREQVVRGRILDEPDRPAPPGYERAVRRYYETLSAGERP